MQVKKQIIADMGEIVKNISNTIYTDGSREVATEAFIYRI